MKRKNQERKAADLPPLDLTRTVVRFNGSIAVFYATHGVDPVIRVVSHTGKDACVVFDPRTVATVFQERDTTYHELLPDGTDVSTGDDYSSLLGLAIAAGLKLSESRPESESPIP